MRPTILTFVAYYLPGYKSGGPVRTIANMVDQLGHEFDFRIITADRDSFETTPYPDIKVNAWNTVGPTQVYYASPSSLRLTRVTELLRSTPHDALYLNSFFNPRFTGLPLLARWLKRVPLKPVILAPRGEFSAGALEIKVWKKKPFIAVSRQMGLFRGVTWQASSDHESEDIRRVIGRAAHDIVVAPNLPALNANDESGCVPAQGGSGGPIRVVFLSRVSPMKNLDFALRVLGQVNVPVSFDIYGIVDDELYWRDCQSQISHLPGNITVTYHGVVPHDQVVPTLRKYDLFFLPTRGENYGHVIPEALAAGVPVLISDQTPWRDLDQKGVGFVRPLSDEHAFVEVIQAQAKLDNSTRNTQRKKAYAYAQRVSADSSVIAQNREMFLDLVKGLVK
ncbi:glycosyltransferase family 4 protein [Desulfocastanea catecholica]